MGFLKLEFLGQIASFNRRLRAAAQMPLALPCLFHTWSGSGVWAERDKRQVRKKCISGGIRPSSSWILAYAELERKKTWRDIYFQVGIISKVAFLFRPDNTFSWSHLEAFGLLSYDCCVDRPQMTVTLCTIPDQRATSDQTKRPN